MISLAAAMALAATSPQTTPPRLPPVERCTGDGGFDRFRAALADAVARKDPRALRLLTANDILSNYGGGASWKEFASTWNLDHPQHSRLWKELQEALGLGCAPTEGGGRVFPGMFEDMGDDEDPFALVVARPGAVLRAAATESSAAVATLDWHSALIVEEPPENPLVKVKLVDGREGWLKSSDMLSPLGYRLVVEKRDGRWKITSLIAGD